jgi:hypothetical protein
MQDRQSGFDHPRSDDVQGRQEGGYEGGFGDRGYGDRGDFGDQGGGRSGHRDSGQDQGAASAGDRGSDASAPPPGSRVNADQSDDGDLSEDD